jgi:hypothetical protein
MYIPRRLYWSKREIFQSWRWKKNLSLTCSADYFLLLGRFMSEGELSPPPSPAAWHCGLRLAETERSPIYLHIHLSASGRLVYWYYCCGQIISGCSATVHFVTDSPPSRWWKGSVGFNLHLNFFFFLTRTSTSPKAVKSSLSSLLWSKLDRTEQSL